VTPLLRDIEHIDRGVSVSLVDRGVSLLITRVGGGLLTDSVDRYISLCGLVVKMTKYRTFVGGLMSSDKSPPDTGYKVGRVLKEYDLLALHDPQLPIVAWVTGRPDADRHADVCAILARAVRLLLLLLLLAALAAHIQLPWGPAGALEGAVAPAWYDRHDRALGSAAAGPAWPPGRPGHARG